MEDSSGGGEFASRRGHEPPNETSELSPVPGITALQVRVAHLFFDLPEAKCFLLVGGASLIANRVVNRVTDDLDLFTRRGAGDVPAAAGALTRAARQAGLAVTTDRSTDEFVRLRIEHEGAAVGVDLAVDAAPPHPPVLTILGPTLDPADAAVAKVLAVFGRAEPRDFTDLRVLCERFDRDRLVTDAARADAGFDPAVLASMMRRITRLPDHRFPISPELLPGLRAWYLTWADELARGRQ